MKELFISFEGIEGSGKSTQAERLYKWLKSKGYDCVFTKEPGGTPVSEKIRNILLDTKNDKLSELAELFLYLADRAQHIKEVIEPALSNGKIVITDRFSDSTLAYQGKGRRIKEEQVKPMNEIATDGIVPDLTILIDILPVEGLKRIKRKDRIELESEDFYQRIRQEYLKIAKENPDRVKVFDGTLPPEKIEKNIREVINPLLKEIN
ncbi:dTMP kinase [candidate division WOR-3 bacterium]|nr:dTMP kinase [candidate division WOR-3 bacterium]